MAALGLGAACSQAARPSEVEMAQVAVRANPALELVATDAQQGVLTVRVRRTGQLLTVKATDVTAGTAFAGLELDAAPATPAPPGTPAASPAATDTTPSPQQQGPAQTPAATVTATRATGSGATDTTTREADVRLPGGLSVTATSKGEAGGTGTRARVTTPGGVTIDATGAGGVGVTTGRRGGQAGSATAASPQAPRTTAPAPATTQPATGRASFLDESKLQRRTTPASCRSGQDASLVGVLLDVPGVAVTVGGGCNMRIRGSLIIGGDTAIVVQDGGNLYVEGSEIQGRQISVQLEAGSNGYLSKSRFQGRVATRPGANMYDQGGNTFQ